MLVQFARYLYHLTIRTGESLSMKEWLFVLACTAAAGLLCMRGFGSRSSH